MLGEKGLHTLFVVQIQRLMDQNTHDISLHTYFQLIYLFLLGKLGKLALQSAKIDELSVTLHAMRQFDNCYKICWCHVAFYK